MEEDLFSSNLENDVTEIVEQIKTCIGNNTTELSTSCLNASLAKLLSSLKENLQKDEKIESLPDIISFILGPVTHILPPQDLDSLIFQPFIPIVKLQMSDVLSSIHLLLESNLPEDTLIPELTKSIDICVQLLNDVNTLLEFILGLNHITTAHVFCLPKNVADIILEVFIHCKKSQEEYRHLLAKVHSELMCLFKKCHKVQLNLLKLLNEKITFNFLSEKEMSLLVEVLNVLQNMAEVVEQLDTMSLVAHWKGFAMLMNTYSHHLTTRMDISCSINYLAANIKHQLDSVDVFVSGDKKSITKLLKITNMQLKILIKLCEQFKFHIGDCHTELLNCLITLSIHSSHYLAKQGVEDDVAAQVTNLSSGAAPLLYHLLLDPKFNQIFLDYPDKLPTSSIQCQLGYCNMVNLVLRKVMQLWPTEKEIQDAWIENSNTILSTVFNILEHCSGNVLILFTENVIYQPLLAHTAAFIVTTCNEENFCEVEQILIKSLLQEHLWPALFSSDLLCLIARLGTSELCLKLTQVLHQMLLSWPSCDRVRLEFLYVSWTLGRMVPLLSFSHRNAFVSDLPPLTDLASDLSSLLTKPVSEDSLTTFNLFMDRSLALGDLTVFPENICAVLSQPVLQFWQHMAVFKEVESSHWSLALYSFLITATSSLIGSYNNIQIANVLDVLLKMSVKSLSLFAFGACEFLRSLAPKVLSNDSSLSVVCERISSLFSQLLLSENPLSQEMGLETFAFFAFVTKYEQIVPETVATHHRLQNDISNFLDGNPIVNCDTTLEDFQKSLAYKFEHKCKIGIKMCTTRVHENPECNPPKKLKVSHEDTEHSSQTLEQRAEWKSENESHLPLHELGNSVQALEENIEENNSKGQDISFEELENALCRVEEGINLVQNYVSLRPLNIQLLTRIGNIKEICSKIVYHRI